MAHSEGRRASDISISVATRESRGRGPRRCISETGTRGPLRGPCRPNRVILVVRLGELVDLLGLRHLVHLRARIVGLDRAATASGARRLGLGWR